MTMTMALFFLFFIATAAVAQSTISVPGHLGGANYSSKGAGTPLPGTTQGSVVEHNGALYFKESVAWAEWSIAVPTAGTYAVHIGLCWKLMYTGNHHVNVSFQGGATPVTVAVDVRPFTSTSGGFSTSSCPQWSNLNSQTTFTASYFRVATVSLTTGMTTMRISHSTNAVYNTGSTTTFSSSSGSSAADFGIRAVEISPATVTPYSTIPTVPTDPVELENYDNGPFEDCMYLNEPSTGNLSYRDNRFPFYSASGRTAIAFPAINAQWSRHFESYANYTINVAAAGRYSITLEAAKLSNTPARYRLWFMGASRPTQLTLFPDSQLWASGAPITTVYLPAGRTTFRFIYASSSWDTLVDRLVFASVAQGSSADASGYTGAAHPVPGAAVPIQQFHSARDGSANDYGNHTLYYRSDVDIVNIGGTTAVVGEPNDELTYKVAVSESVTCSLRLYYARDGASLSEFRVVVVPIIDGAPTSMGFTYRLAAGIGEMAVDRYAVFFPKRETGASLNLSIRILSDDSHLGEVYYLTKWECANATSKPFATIPPHPPTEPIEFENYDRAVSPYEGISNFAESTSGGYAGNDTTYRSDHTALSPDLSYDATSRRRWITDWRPGEWLMFSFDIGDPGNLAANPGGNYNSNNYLAFVFIARLPSGGSASVKVRTNCNNIYSPGRDQNGSPYECTSASITIAPPTTPYYSSPFGAPTPAPPTGPGGWETFKVYSSQPVPATPGPIVFELESGSVDVDKVYLFPSRGPYVEGRYAAQNWVTPFVSNVTTTSVTINASHFNYDSSSGGLGGNCWTVSPSSTSCKNLGKAGFRPLEFIDVNFLDGNMVVSKFTRLTYTLRIGATGMYRLRMTGVFVKAGSTMGSVVLNWNNQRIAPVAVYSTAFAAVDAGTYLLEAGHGQLTFTGTLSAADFSLAEFSLEWVSAVTTNTSSFSTPPPTVGFAGLPVWQFDNGAEGYAYHKVALPEAGFGIEPLGSLLSPRPGSPFEFLQVNRAAPGITNLREGEWLRYTFTMPVTGMYEVSFDSTSTTTYGGSTSTTYTLEFDGNPATTANITIRDGAFSSARVTLTAGEHQMKLIVTKVEVPSSGFNFGPESVNALPKTPDQLYSIMFDASLSYATQSDACLVKQPLASLCATTKTALISNCQWRSEIATLFSSIETATLNTAPPPVLVPTPSPRFQSDPDTSGLGPSAQTPAPFATPAPLKQGSGTMPACGFDNTTSSVNFTAPAGVGAALLLLREATFETEAPESLVGLALDLGGPPHRTTHLTIALSGNSLIVTQHTASPPVVVFSTQICCGATRLVERNFGLFWEYRYHDGDEDLRYSAVLHPDGQGYVSQGTPAPPPVLNFIEAHGCTIQSGVRNEMGSQVVASLRTQSSYQSGSDTALGCVARAPGSPTAPFAPLYATYESGSIERLAALSVDSNNEISVSDGSVPLPSINPCVGNGTWLGADRVRNRGDLPRIVAVAFNPSQTIRSLTFVSLEAAPVLLLGVTWIRKTSTCSLPSYRKWAMDVVGAAFVSKSANLISYNIDRTSGQTERQPVPSECSSTLFTGPGVGAVSMSPTEASFVTALSCASTNVPQIPSLLSSAPEVRTVVKAVGVVPQLTKPPATSGPRLGKPLEFATAAGYSKVLLNLQRTASSIGVVGVTEAALIVPGTHFATASTSAASFILPGLAAQCGGVMAAFKERDNAVPAAAAPCRDWEYRTCGHASLPATTGRLDTLLNDRAIENTAACNDTVIHGVVAVKGTLAAPTVRLFYVSSGVASSTTQQLKLDFEDQPMVEVGWNDSVAALSTRACVFDDAPGFEATDAVVPTALSGCRQANPNSTVDFAISACAADPDCGGFVTAVLPYSPRDVPICFFKANAVFQAEPAPAWPGGASLGANHTSWRKRVASTGRRICRIKMPSAVSYATVVVPQTDWKRPSHTIVVSVDGRPAFRCGGRHGFAGTKGTTGSCQTTKTCFDGPLLVPAGGVIDVSIPASVSSQAVCPFAAVVHFKFSGSQLDFATPFATLPLSRRFSVSATVGTTLKFRAALSGMGLLYQDVYTTNTTHPLPPGRPLIRASTIAAPARRRQAATTNTTRLLCGGTAHSAFATTSQCGTLSLCGGPDSTARDAGTGSVIVGFPAPTSAPDTIEISVDPAPQSEGGSVDQSCLAQNVGTELKLQLFFAGRPVTVIEDTSSVRVMFTAAAGTNPTSLVTAAGFAATAYRPLATTLSFTAGPLSAGPTVVQPFDVSTMSETSKAVDSVGTAGTFVCLVDSFTDPTTYPSCRVPVAGGTMLVVRVAQTAFVTDPGFAVSVDVGRRRTQCSQSREFYGVAATSRNQGCGRYLSCYVGIVDPGVTEALITWTPPALVGLPGKRVDAETGGCENTAVAVASVLRSATDFPCELGQMRCVANGTCLAEVRVCDGIVDCGDGSDEAYCSHYRILGTTLTLNCPETFVMPPRDLISKDDCIRWTAVTVGIAGSSHAMLFEENVKCVAYGCMWLDSPGTALAQVTVSEGELYARAESIDDFEYCLAALHCGGHGTVGSTTPPCACTCDEGYIGDSCDVRMDMGTVKAVVFAFDSGAFRPGAVPRSILDADFTALASLLSTLLPSGFGLSVTEKLILGDGDYARVTVEATNPAANSVEVALANRALLTPNATAAVRQHFTSNGLFYNDSTSQLLFRTTVTGTCVISQTTLNTRVQPWSTFNPSCVIQLESGQIASALWRSVGYNQHVNEDVVPQLVTAIDFYFRGLSIPSNGTVNTEEWQCDGSWEIYTNQSMRDRKCATAVHCRHTPSTPVSVTSFTVDIDRAVTVTSAGCDPEDNGVVVYAEFQIVLPLPDPIGRYPVAITSRSTKSNGSLVVAQIQLMVVILLGLLSCCCRCRNKCGESDPETGCCCGCCTPECCCAIGHRRAVDWYCCCTWLVYCLLCAAFILFAISQQREVIASHVMMIDEHRSPHCRASPLGPIPNRVLELAADGKCTSVKSFGSQEGAVFVKGLCSGSAAVGIEPVKGLLPIPTGTAGSAATEEPDTGTYFVAAGRTLNECQQAAYIPVVNGTCRNETDIFPWKAVLDTQYVSFRCLSNGPYARRDKWSWVTTMDMQAQLRETMIKGVYQKDYPMTGVATVAALPALLQVEGVEDRTVFFQGASRFAVAKLDGPTMSPALAAFTNIELPELAKLQMEPVTFVHQNTSWPPSVVGSGPNDLSDRGIVFNDFGSALATRGKEAGARAARVRGIRGTRFDIASSFVGSNNPTTITFWMKASSESRGFVFVASDAWYSRDTFASPIADTFLSKLEGGAYEGASFANDTFHLYWGLYIDGESQALSFVLANPDDDGQNAGIQVLPWPMTALGVERAFDGGWHFMAIALSEFSGRRFAQLFVDGQTSFSASGWKQCFDEQKTMQDVRELQVGSTVRVTSALEETVQEGGLLYIGYFNGGVYNLQVHDGFIEQERVVGMGAEGMKAFVDFDRTVNMGFAAAVLVFSLVSLIWSGVTLKKQLDLAEALEEKHDAEETADASAGGATGASAFVVQVTGKNEGAKQMTNIAPMALTTMQTMNLYMLGFQWPSVYEAWIGPVVTPIAIDLSHPELHLTGMYGPLALFGVASFLMLLVIYISRRDKGTFERRVVQRAKNRADGLEDEHLKDEIPMPNVSDVPRPDFAFALESKAGKTFHVCDESVADVAVAVAQGEKGANGEAFDGAPLALQVQRSDDGPMIAVRGTLHFAPAGRDDKDHFRITMVLSDVADQIGKPGDALPLHVSLNIKYSCPRHGGMLLKASEKVHGAVSVGGKWPYRCAFQDHPWYAASNDERHVCFGIEGTEFFVCEEDDCAYCVCQTCSPFGVITRRCAELKGWCYSTSRLGSMGAVGFVIIALAQLVYLPVLQTAAMILYNHPLFQCQFPDGYDGFFDGGVSLFTVSVTFSAFITVFFGIGLIVYLYSLVVGRKFTLIESGALDGHFVSSQADVLNNEGETDADDVALVQSPGAEAYAPGTTAAVDMNDEDDAFAIAAAQGPADMSPEDVVQKKAVTGVFGMKTTLPRPQGYFAMLTADVDREVWGAIMQFDETMLESLYSCFDCRNMALHPMFLLFKILLVLPIVLLDPNSIAQLGVAAVVEGAQLGFLLVTYPYLNPWVDWIGKLGSIHQLVQLAWMAVHRVLIFDRPSSDGLAGLMVATTFAYVLVLLFVFVKVAMVPMVVGYFARLRELRVRQETADGRIFNPDAAFPRGAVRWATFLKTGANAASPGMTASPFNANASMEVAEDQPSTAATAAATPGGPRNPYTVVEEEEA